MPARPLALLLALVPAAAVATPPPDWTARLPPAPFDAVHHPVSGQDAAGMITIPAGTFRLGRDDGPAAEGPAHAVTLAGFRIDRTEVTNAAFAEFLNALPLLARGTAPAGRVGAAQLDAAGIAALTEGPEGSGRYPIIALDDDQARIGIAAGRFAVTPGFEAHPVTETSWAGAAAYCAWRGARLPTEAEWEAAARGPEARPFPWGAAPPDPPPAPPTRGNGQSRAVGTHPAGATPEGVQDLAGSLAEWTSTLRRPYPYRATDGREDPGAPGERVTRGGDYRYDRETARLRATHRVGFSNAPERGHRHIGFRCAATAS